jgi:hypothetical protein
MVGPIKFDALTSKSLLTNHILQSDVDQKEFPGLVIIPGNSAQNPHRLKQAFAEGECTDFFFGHSFVWFKMSMIQPIPTAISRSQKRMIKVVMGKLQSEIFTTSPTWSAA